MRDLARAAVLEVADGEAHVGALLSEDRLEDVTVIRFASLHPGYPGWQWSVALVGDGARATVNEVWMEPGEGALALPEWKPWSERVRPGDLGAGDVIATDPADVRLTPGYTGEDTRDDEPELRPAQWEIGLGRARVLSAEGLADAAERWRSGDDGPDAQIARLADHPCSTCAWLLPIGGLLGQAFGVCAHDMSPSDGHIVAMDHGCGAHSDVKERPTPVPVTEMLIDELLVLPLPMRRESGDDLADADEVAEGDDSAPEGAELSASSAQEAPASADDVPDAQEAHDDAGEGDITPPERIMLAEDVVEDQGQQGE